MELLFDKDLFIGSLQVFETIPFKDIYVNFGQRVMFSLICGVILGIEREINGKHGGLRTTVIICLGSMVFAYFSELMLFNYQSHKADPSVLIDPGRMSAQIITGLAFLGSGMLLTGKDRVYGISSAILVWITGVVGILIGHGYYIWAVSFSFLVFFVLQIDEITGFLYKKTAKTVEVKLEVDTQQNLAQILNLFLLPGFTYKKLSLVKEADKKYAHIEFKVELRARHAFVKACNEITNNFLLEVKSKWVK